MDLERHVVAPAARVWSKLLFTVQVLGAHADWLQPNAGRDAGGHDMIVAVLSVSSRIRLDSESGGR